MATKAYDALQANPRKSVSGRGKLVNATVSPYKQNGDGKRPVDLANAHTAVSNPFNKPLVPPQGMTNLPARKGS